MLYFNSTNHIIYVTLVCEEKNYIKICTCNVTLFYYFKEKLEFVYIDFMAILVIFINHQEHTNKLHKIY